MGNTACDAMVDKGGGGVGFCGPSTHGMAAKGVDKDVSGQAEEGESKCCEDTHY